jgi:hypothetical protein
VPYGSLTENQAKVIQSIIKGKVVHDLGSGDLGLSRQLLQLGASQVVVVDKEDFGDPKVENLTVVRSLFYLYEAPIDIAFVSWPANYNSHLTSLLKRARIVIYLGSNTEGSSCGYKGFWDYLSTRKVVASVEDRKNSLLVYHWTKREDQETFPEESAALSQYNEVCPEIRPYGQKVFDEVAPASIVL